ncbi:hypothetical protein FACS1894132_01730 [Clostridia bacterium]|nr:hypothetical protein FACS1894132_01730 [Clostridia bacterium]
MRIKDSYENITPTMKQEEEILSLIDKKLKTSPNNITVSKRKMFMRNIPIMACFAVALAILIAFPSKMSENKDYEYSKNESYKSFFADESDSYAVVPPSYVEENADRESGLRAEGEDVELEIGEELPVEPNILKDESAEYYGDGDIVVDVYLASEGEPTNYVEPQAGMLTASKIDDVADFAHFKDYLREYQSFWDFPTTYFNIIQRDNSPKTALDLMFTIDTTGSMSDELSYLQIELANVITRVKNDNAQIPVRLSVNFYRDNGDDYVVKPMAFTNDIKNAIKIMKEENCDGGGDFEEAVEVALADAIEKHNWSVDNKTARLLFLVLDAPPHQTAKINQQIRDLVLEAQEKDIVILPVAASGIDKDTERLLRQMAVITNGTYQFLTNNSYGIGGDHLTPTDTEYEALPLNDLLVNIINSYL